MGEDDGEGSATTRCVCVCWLRGQARDRYSHCEHQPDAMCAAPACGTYSPRLSKRRFGGVGCAAWRNAGTLTF